MRGAVNSAKLKNAVLGMESGELTFFKFYEQFLSDYEKKVNSGLRVNGTRSKYKILLKHLRNFAFTKYGYSDVPFNDLTPDFVQNFDYYLRDDIHSQPLRFHPLLLQCFHNALPCITQCGFL